MPSSRNTVEYSSVIYLRSRNYFLSFQVNIFENETRHISNGGTIHSTPSAAFLEEKNRSVEIRFVCMKWEQ